MTVALWASNMARLVLVGPDGHRDILLVAPATVVVDGRWLTLQVGETRKVFGGGYRLATEADVLALPPAL